MVFNFSVLTKDSPKDPDSVEQPSKNSFMLYSEDSKKNHKFNWYWAFVFGAVWYLLFYVAIIPSFYYFPKMLKIKDEESHKGKFIGERAEKDLFQLASIGVKVVGSQEYFRATTYLMNRVQEIKDSARLDLYDIDIQLQTADGEFFLWDSLISYADIFNVIVRVKPKNVKSEAALLVNSHYDSEIGSPAAGDAGLMIVIMLETMRVISQSDTPLDHAIIFLYNGGEENPMMGSHAFITKHPWAIQAKALINLDSAGNGGREILFQSGPDHPWLMKYYHKSVPSPFASTIAEELFQNNFIPSDTDFRIFRDYGGVPGLDMAHTYGGYTYHMKFDSYKNIPQGSFQLTGDNVLALTKSLANAYELDDIEKYKEGHTVFYDVVGWFLVSYTENNGVIINTVVSSVAVIAIGVSLWLMFQDITIFAGTYAMNIFIMFAIQAASILIAVGVNLLVGVIIDAIGLPLAWYTSPWLLFGLYYCPAFFVLGFGSACYLTLRKDNPIPLRFCVQVFLHSHAFVLALFTIILTAMGIRSAFFPMVALFFYTISLIMNLATQFYKRGKLWIIPHCLCQILPFWFYTYLSYAFLVTFIPMQARIGPGDNPEILLAIFTVLFAILFAGFLIPLINLFRKTKLLFSVFAIIFVVFVIIAATPAGFPYKEEEAPQRFYVLNTNRVFNEFNGTVSRSESGYFVMPVDRRPTSVKKYVKDFDKRIDLKDDCENEVFCGVPLYSGRWLWWGKQGSYFIPGPKPDYSNYPVIDVVKTDTYGNTKKFNMNIYGPPTTIVFIKPLGGAKLKAWNRSNDLFEKNVEPPYFLYFSYADSVKPLVLEMEFEKEDGNMDEETVQIVAAGHWVFHKDKYTKEFNEFLDSWPKWTYQTSWFASYESWKF